MTNEEFSNAFDTLLNAYKHKAEFGEQSSIADVSVDEYEKSIFLTQAQDNIVKNYFQRTLNAAGDGFDDSTRRQMDFSTLITVKTIDMTSATKSAGFSENGYIVSFKDADFKVGSRAAYPLFIINERVTTKSTITGGGSYTFKAASDDDDGFLYVKNISTYSISITIARNGDTADYYKSSVTVSSSMIYITIYLGPSGTSDTLEARINGDSTVNTYIKATDPQLDSESYTLSDSYTKTQELDAGVITNKGLSYVVVPINYKDYDRMMSRAYCEPLKRQAWRLFEASSTDLSRQAEIVLRTDADTPTSYIVRYVRRPQPIVLVNLANTDNSLTIDGVTAITECELNPIVHQEILNEAVRLALAANGIVSSDIASARQTSSQK